MKERPPLGDELPMTPEKIPKLGRPMAQILLNSRIIVSLSHIPVRTPKTSGVSGNIVIGDLSTYGAEEGMEPVDLRLFYGWEPLFINMDAMLLDRIC